MPKARRLNKNGIPILDPPNVNGRRQPYKCQPGMHIFRDTDRTADSFTEDILIVQECIHCDETDTRPLGGH